MVKRGWTGILGKLWANLACDTVILQLSSIHYVFDY